MQSACQRLLSSMFHFANATAANIGYQLERKALFAQHRLNFFFAICILKYETTIIEFVSEPMT